LNSTGMKITLDNPDSLGIETVGVHPGQSLCGERHHARGSQSLQRDQRERSVRTACDITKILFPADWHNRIGPQLSVGRHIAVVPAGISGSSWIGWERSGYQVGREMGLEMSNAQRMVPGVARYDPNLLDLSESALWLLNPGNFGRKDLSTSPLTTSLTEWWNRYVLA